MFALHPLVGALLALMADQQPPEQSASYLSRLREGEQQWAWKIGMRAAIIILDLIGIGCAAWLLATVIDLDYYSFYDYTLDNEIMPFVLPAVSHMQAILSLLISLTKFQTDESLLDMVSNLRPGFLSTPSTQSGASWRSRGY